MREWVANRSSLKGQLSLLLFALVSVPVQKWIVSRLLTEWCSDVNLHQCNSGSISGLGTMCRLSLRSFFVCLTPAVFVTRIFSTESWSF